LDSAVGRVIFDTATQAGADTADGRQDAPIRAVSVMTGGGKSTSAWAYIAAAAAVDPEFSAAYLVPTVRAALEAKAGIEELLGANTVCCWNWATKHNRNEGKVREELGQLPSFIVHRDEIPLSRVVILTHELWRTELSDQRDYGARNWRGKPRDVLFIDESPDLVSIHSAQPSDLQGLHDALMERRPDHAWLPVLRSVVGRMNAAIGEARQEYGTAALVSRSEGKHFQDANYAAIFPLTNPALSRDARDLEVALYGDLCRFLSAASLGSVFYSLHDRRFYAYRLDGDPSGPGMVLLDATSDWSDLAILGSADRVPVPKADYSRLELLHLDHPPAFRRIDKVVKEPKRAKDYGHWIQQAVLANTVPGDDVLIVAHKACFDWSFCPSSRDPDKPMDWQGRKVNTEHFGAGIGLNLWRHKNVVMIFGEFIRPRWATIAAVNAYSTTRPSNDRLRLAVGTKQADDYIPRDPQYATAHEAHILRWSKQLAMRGAARIIDGDGRCKPMRLVLSMGYERLIRNLDKLFPGCPKPRAANDPASPRNASDRPLKPTGRDGLVRLLVDREKPLYGADEIERITNIRTFQLAKALSSPRIRGVADTYGWRLVPAKALGKHGRMKYLVHVETLLRENTRSL
jgi:hypothetical protein